MNSLDYSIRELRIEDYDNGFLDCLKELTVVGNITKEMFIDTFNERKEKGIFTVVAIENKTRRILGTGSVFYEPKFIRECSWKAYIEDISIAKYAQKRGVGKRIVKHLEEKALRDGCYKVILTCNEENKEFYQKMRFKRIEDAMAIYSNDLK